MFTRLLRAIRNLLGLKRVERDLTDEIAGYEDMLAAEYREAGMTDASARRQARLHIGSADAIKEKVRDGRAGVVVEQTVRELRYAVRTLTRTPGFTAFVVLTFAVAIGGLSVIFSLVDAMLLRPLPYPESHRLVIVLEADARRPVGGYSAAAPNFLDWRRMNTVFQRMALYEYLTYNLSEGGEPEQVGGLRVTGGVFDLLGVAPMLGRGLLPADDPEGTANVVVLSYRLWQRRYGGDSAIVGRNITINKQLFQVIGIMPRGFAFPTPAQQLWTGIHLNTEDQGRSSHSFISVARLKPGITVEQARAELRGIGDRLAQEYPVANAGETANVFPMRELWIQDVQDTLRSLLIAVAMVLLIAAANIASLLVARDSARRREIAARMALGGSRGRIIRQLVTESVLLALTGGAVGLVLAIFGLRALLTVFPPGLRNVPFRDLSAITLSPAVFGVAVLAALVAGIVAGLAPALTTLPTEPAEILRDSGTRGATARKSRRLKSVLVGVEVALAVIVLVAAGLLVSSIQRVQRVAPGLDPSNVLAIEMSLPQADFYGQPARLSYCTDVAREVRAVPGVVSVSALSHVPLTGSSAGRSFVLEGAPDPGPGETPSAQYSVACPGAFGVLGIPILEGRDFTEADRTGAPPVMIINKRLAKQWFPTGSGLGKRIKLGRFDSPDNWITIVGLVADVHHNGQQMPVEAALFAPYTQAVWPRMSVLVRTAAAPAALVKPVREALRRAAPEEPIGDDTTMDAVLEASLGHLKFPMVLFSVFAAMALALAALGCFGVASQAVIQRRRELGIRIALGAPARQVYRLVLRQSMIPVGWGLGVGILGAVASTRVLKSMLFDIAPTDPLTLGLGALVLAVATAGACLLPAHRAARVDPILVLRDE